MSTPKILSGKEVRQAVYVDLEQRIAQLAANHVIPGLAVILIGDDPASRVYVQNKSKQFENLGLYSRTIIMDETVTQQEVIQKIEALNSDNKIHGILVQLPLPDHLDEDKLVSVIDPLKDVDGFHPQNMGRLVLGRPRYIPCTPKGIMRMFKHFDIDLSGKHIVVIGRSNIVGRPISILTSLKNTVGNGTTTLCHSRTPNIRSFTRQADIIISAIGIPHFVDETFIKPGAVLVDVGMNRIKDPESGKSKLVGDIHYEQVVEQSGAITPVPGGVGIMTVAMLVENTIESAERTLKG